MKWPERLMVFLSGAAALVMAWGIASWINVILHNTSDYVYAGWNLFKILGW